MKGRDLGAAVLVAASGVTMLAGCGDGGGARSAATSPAVTGTPSSTRPRHHATAGVTKEEGMRIEITIEDQRFQATLDDSAACLDLLAQLPQTVRMRDHGGVEKTGPLGSALSLEGQPPGADPSIGDLGYYAPGGTSSSTTVTSPTTRASSSPAGSTAMPPSASRSSTGTTPPTSTPSANARDCRRRTRTLSTPRVGARQQSAPRNGSPAPSRST